MSTRRSTPENSKALNTFIAKKAEIDAQLERLKALSDEHFNAPPDEIHWGHVGDLQRYAALLRQISDAAFREGEFAA